MSRRRRDRYRFRRIKVDGPWCTYCGMPADTEDHFPPLSVSNSGFLLPACRRCNLFASNLYAFDFNARVRRVQESIERRFGSLLTMPDWDGDEISELGENLRRYVESWRERKRLAHGQIVWDAMAYLRSIAPANVFAALNAKTPGIPESGLTPLKSIENLKTCEECGKQFQPKARNGSFQRFCRTKCAGLAKRKRRKTRADLQAGAGGGAV